MPGSLHRIFSVIQTVLIRPFPYQDADHLVNIFEKEPKNGVQRYFVSPSGYYDWRDRSRTLEAFAAYRRNEVNLMPAMLRSGSPAPAWRRRWLNQIPRQRQCGPMSLRR